MSTIEFQTELSGQPTLVLPPDVIARLPKSGTATVVLLVGDDAEDEAWRQGAYEHFMKDDNAEDSIYDSY